jgi:hypothetical protein
MNNRWLEKSQQQKERWRYLLGGLALPLFLLRLEYLQATHSCSYMLLLSRRVSSGEVVQCSATVQQICLILGSILGNSLVLYLSFISKYSPIFLVLVFLFFWIPGREES